MPSVSGKFTGIYFASVANASNLLEGNTGNLSFNEGNQVQYRSPNLPDIFASPNIRVTGFKWEISFQLLPSTKWSLLLLDQQSDGTVISTGNLIERFVGTSVQTFGGENDLSGLNWSKTVSDLTLFIAMPNQAGDRDGSLILNPPGLEMEVFYTTHSKVSQTGGKLSVDSGKISIT